MSKIGQQLKTNMVLRQPHVTEKSTLLADNKNHPVYVFEVTENTTKTEIKKAFLAKYKIAPIKINIVNIPKRRTIHRGRASTKSGVKKALIYLKSGEKIETS